MTPAQMLLWALAAVAMVFCARRGAMPARRAVTETGQSLMKILPLFAVALPMAAFLAELVPADAASAWIGRESGLSGIAVGAVAGGFMPGGPFVTFPLVIAFAKAGAGVPQMTALVTGWAIYGIHRIVTWEYPVLGWRFVALRMLAGLPLPILAGILAEFVEMAVPITLGHR